MVNQGLQIQTALQIQKPVNEVFEAIVDPVKMSNYFIAKSTGRLEQGKEVIWKFPEFEEEAPVKAGLIEPDHYISFSWEVDGKEHIVEISLSRRENDSTLVQIKERGGENNEQGIVWLKQNTEGWANFLACLKAWLEYGINLRKGAFDFMRK